MVWRSGYTDQIERPATLVLDLRAQEIQDLVIISFLMIEKDNRARGKEMP